MAAKNQEIVLHPAWEPTVRDLVRQLGSDRTADSIFVSVDGVSVEIRITRERAGIRRRSDVPEYTVHRSGTELRLAVQRRYSLTEREAEVVLLIHDGMRNDEIARALGVSVGTVKRHVYNLFNKVGVDSRNHLLYRLRNDAP